MMRAIVAKEHFGRYGVFTPYTDWSNRLIFALDWWRASLQPALGQERHAADIELETLKASRSQDAALAILNGLQGVETAPSMGRRLLLSSPTEPSLNVYETNHRSAGRRPHGRA
jgi:hypothetical protein